MAYKNRSIPYEKYFGEMGIPASSKAERTAFAEGLEDRMLLIFALVEVYAKYGRLTQQWLEGEIERTYVAYAAQFLNIDDYVTNHIKSFSKVVAESIMDNLPSDDRWLRFDEINALSTGKTEAENTSASSQMIPARQKDYEPYEPEDEQEDKGMNKWLWLLSLDRAIFIAENEANDMMEYAGYLDAIEAGMTSKTWCTVGDSRVRDAHADTEGQTVGIDDYFLVGDEYGLFPGDTEHLSAENTISCRCWLEYSE